jgi:glyoxylase-like metal-dependent hydrolase (beta-lactamase superfamily II)
LGDNAGSMSATPVLPPDIVVFERGWLSSNNILLLAGPVCALVDSGYCTHSGQTLALLRQSLGRRPLDLLLNTHLHSDHCGGNALLQQSYPALQTLIPPGLSEHVRNWNVSGHLSTPYRHRGN